MTEEKTTRLPADVVRNLKASAYQGRFGGCPVCGHAEGPVNVLKENWFICRAHRIKWRAGINLIEVYPFEWEAWEAIDKLLSYFQEVPGRDALCLDEEAERHDG